MPLSIVVRLAQRTERALVQVAAACSCAAALLVPTTAVPASAVALEIATLEIATLEIETLEVAPTGVAPACESLDLVPGLAERRALALPADDASIDRDLRIEVDPGGAQVTVTVERATGSERTFEQPTGRWGRSVLRLAIDRIERPSALVVRGGSRGSVTVCLGISERTTDDRERAAELAWTKASRAWSLAMNLEDPSTIDPAKSFRRTAEAARQAGDRQLETLALLNAGSAALLRPQGRSDGGSDGESDGGHDAASLLERAAALAEGDAAAPFPHLLAEALDELGLAAWRRGAHDDARRWLDRALALRERLDDPLGVAETTTNLALVAQVRGETDDARSGYLEALEIARRVGAPRFEASVTQNLATLHHEAGALRDAVDSYRAVLESRRRIGEPQRSATTHMNLALALWTLGELRDARSAYREALAIQERLGDVRGRGAALNGLGKLELMLGEPEIARDLFVESLEARRAADDRRGLAATLQNLATAERRLGRTARAESFLRRALEIRLELGDRRGEAASRHALADLLAGDGLDSDTDHEPDDGDLRRAEALEHVEQALEIRRRIDPLRAAASLRLRAELTLARDPLHAIDDLESALATQRAAGYRDQEAVTLGVLARAEQARDEQARDDDLRPDLRNGDRAIARLDGALERIDGLRVEVAAPERRATFLADRSALYESLIEIHVEQALAGGPDASAHVARAFETAERRRARSLLDRLEQLDPEHRRRLDRLAELRLRARREARAGTVADETSTAIERLLVELRRSAADPPITLREAQALLDRETAHLAIFLGSRQSVAWVVTRDDVSLHRLPDAASLEALARQALDDWSILDVGAQADTRDDRPQSDAPATAQLAALVLEPARETLERHRRWLVVADGALGAVPFAALPFADSSPALDDHEVIHAPSIAAIRTLRRRQSLEAERLVVVADPRLPPTADDPSPTALPASRREARAVADAFAGDGRTVEIALGAEASRERVLGGLLDGASHIHFATHGVVDPARPGVVGLLLAASDEAPDDGTLDLADIDRLRLDTDLVVLSGCRTALGRSIPGEGMLGTGRAFLLSGARRVIASLWPVADRPTAELMERLYGRLGEGASPAAALRHAQRALRSETPWRDPAYWAAFVVSGDWRQARDSDPAGEVDR